MVLSTVYKGRKTPSALFVDRLAPCCLFAVFTSRCTPCCSFGSLLVRPSAATAGVRVSLAACPPGSGFRPHPFSRELHFFEHDGVDFVDVVAVFGVLAGGAVHAGDLFGVVAESIEQRAWRGNKRAFAEIAIGGVHALPIFSPCLHDQFNEITFSVECSLLDQPACFASAFKIARFCCQD